MIVLTRVHALILVGKLLSPQITKFMLCHDYILKSFKRNYFIFVPDRGLGKVLYRPKVIEIFK